MRLQWDTTTHIAYIQGYAFTHREHNPTVLHFIASYKDLCEAVKSICMLCVNAGGEQPIPLWNEHDTSTDADKPKILLYSLSLMFKVKMQNAVAQDFVTNFSFF